MPKRKIYDHEAIGRVYRAGLMSNREIGAQFDVSHTMINRWAKKYGWEKDLSSRVRVEVSNKLVSKVSKSNTDEEIVDAASDIGVGIVESHRKDIAALQELEESLIEELSGNPTKLYLAQYQGEIIEKVVELTAAERAQASNNMANVQHKRVALQRQAHGLDVPEGEQGDKRVLDDLSRAARINSLIELARRREDGEDEQ